MMRPEQLRSARKAKGLTQQEAARRLGVSQAYLALMESGRRRVTEPVRAGMSKVYGLGPTALPFDVAQAGKGSSASVAGALARLGYPGFGHVRKGRKANPAVVLLTAIAASDLEVRVVEALPWLVTEYADLDWEWLVRESKLRDVQNRLGFLVTLARHVADDVGDETTGARLRDAESALEHARLAREDSLCQASLSEAERRWLRERRSTLARHWNLLTDLDQHPLPYAA